MLPVGMGPKMADGMTEQQREFATHYVANGGNGAEAARQAGYAEKSARSSAYKLLRLPHVQAAIKAEQRRVLSEIASLALGQARAMLESKDTPAGARVTLITAVLDRGGLTPVKASADDTPIDAENLRNLSLAELEELIARRVPRPSGPPKLAVVGEAEGDAPEEAGAA
jgi:hypothetical protein